MSKHRKRNSIPPAFDGSFVQLVREMDGAKRAIDVIPDSQKLPQYHLSVFDDVRFAALRLAEAAEALVERFDGDKGL